MRNAKKIRQQAIYYGEWLMIVDENPALGTAAEANKDFGTREGAEAIAIGAATWYQREMGCGEDYARGIAYQAGLAAGYELAQFEE